MHPRSLFVFCFLSVAAVSLAPAQTSGNANRANASQPVVLDQFTVTGQSGQEYIIQASTNLVNWVDVYTNPDYTAPFNFVDPNATNYTSRFYRVVTGP